MKPLQALLVVILLQLMPGAAAAAANSDLLAVANATAPNLTVRQQLKRLDEIKLEDQAYFRAELARLRQLPLAHQDDTDYLTLLTAYEQALQGQYDKVLPTLTPLLEGYASPEFIARARIVTVNVLLLSNDHSLAFTYFDELINSIPAIKDPELLAQVIALAMFTYNQLERYDLSLLYVRYIDFDSVSAKLACRIRVTALDAKYQQSGVTVSSEETNNVINECVAVKEVIPANLARKELMRHLLKNNDSAEALSLYRQHIDEIIQTKYPILISQIRVLAAQAHLQQGELKQATELAEQALQAAQASPNNFAVIEAYDTLYQVAKVQQNFPQALQHLEKTREMESKLNADKASRQAAYHTVRSEIELKNQRINLLDRDNELLFLQQSIYQEEAKNSRLMLVLAALAGFIALMLAYRGLVGRKRFKLMAEYDQLTGVSNRYHFNNQARLALKHSQTKQLPVAIILFDLDHFKLINDQYGHATGDWGLQQVVQTCKQFMRSNDIFARIGGEEFVIMMPGCALDKATLMAEICRDAIVNIDCSASSHQFTLSASFGVSGSESSGYDLKQLLANADKAMYRAKAKGRNQVVEFQIITRK